MDTRKLSLVLAGLLAVAIVFAAQSNFGQALFGRWTFTKSVTNDRSRFYRVIVNLAYKGEPQAFDIVVGCNVKLTTYRDNSRTSEIGLIPQVFGRRMKDGKAVVIAPPRACNGETTANGGVQPDLRPIII